MKIAIVGGGPAGLYLARLVRMRIDGSSVTVFEQNAADATFGFGVGLGGKARDRIRALDPEIHDRITSAMVFSNRQRIHLDGADTVLEYAQAGGAIGRLELLQILRSACHEVGVAVNYQVRIDRPTQLSGYDLIVGADGINSLVRRWYEKDFGTRTRVLTNHFAWFGVGRFMQPGSLVFRTTPHGRFVGHYYPYATGMSTFVPECDAKTWTTSGLSQMSDDDRRRYIETVFAPELNGSPLIENRSIWRNFPAVTNERWSSGHTVLIGDALLSAHFSIGSGTRLAMDDAEALFRALTATTDVKAALQKFEEIRRPSREAFRVAAEKSYNWYERLAEVMAQEPLDFVYDFLTRTGRIDDARLAEYAPAFFKLYTDTKSRRQREKV